MYERIMNFMVSDNVIRNIFNKLPIGYYLGRNVRSCVLDTQSDMSYYAPILDKIVISMKMIKDASAKIDEDEYNENEIESLIRGLLYHEIGHVILSGNMLDVLFNNKYLVPDSFHNIFGRMSRKYIKNIVNIFEDERIETILANSFLNTNFKKNLLRIVDVDDCHDNNPVEKFFKLVRFRIGDPELLQKVDDLIDKYKTIPYRHTACYYISDVLDLFMEVYNSIPQEDNNQSGFEDQQNNNSSNPEEGESDSSLDKETLDNLLDLLDQGNIDIVKKQYQGVPDDLKQLVTILIEDETQNTITDIDQASSKMENPVLNKKLVDRVNKIFNDSKTLAKKNSSATNAYSGVFDPRSAGREDCRFFMNRSRNGSSRMYSKYNLNLYIDCSGSFSRSQDAVNELLYAIKAAESSNPNFSVNIAAIGDSVHRFDCTKIFVCNEGTALDEEIFPIVKEYTRPDAVNRSIVLIDGDAFECGTEKPECFRAFDSKDFYLIVDSENEKYVKRYAPKAHTIIHDPKTATKTYEELLTERVLSALEVLTKI